MILPSTLLGKLDAFCNLPQQLASRYKSAPFAAVQFVWDDERGEGDGRTHYVGWIGGVSQSDALELPYSLFESGSSHHSIRLEAVLTHVEDASEVFFSPLSGYDWDVISTQAAVVESNLLTQMSVAYEGQVIRIQISSTLSASLKCTSVATKSKMFSTASSSDESPAALNVTMAKLSAHTLAIVAPYSAADNGDTDNGHGRAISRNSGSSFAGLPDSDCVSEMALVEEGSVLLPLRVLPQALRSVDTGYSNVESIINSVKSLTNKGVCSGGGLLEDLLSEGLWQEAEHSYEAKMEKKKMEEHPELISDGISCLVHPLFIQCAFEAASDLSKKDDTAEKKLRLNVSVRPCYIGVLYLDTGSDTQGAVDKAAGTAKPLVDCIIVSVSVSAAVRPGHVSLPDCVRRAIGAAEYSHVRLRVKGTTGAEGNTLGAPIMPYEISLQRVRWTHIPEGEGSASPAASAAYHRRLGDGNRHDKHNGNNGNNAKNSYEYDGLDSSANSTDRLDAVREAFVRLFEQHRDTIKQALIRDRTHSSSSGPRGREGLVSSEDIDGDGAPLILSDGSIITLEQEAAEAPESDGHSISGVRESNGIGNLNYSGSPLKSLLKRKNGSRMVSVDYLVRIYRSKEEAEVGLNIDNDVISKVKNEKGDEVGKIRNSREEKKWVANKDAVEYVLIDCEERIMTCLDVMALRPERSMVTPFSLHRALRGQRGRGEGWNDRSPLGPRSLLHPPRDTQQLIQSFDQDRPSIPLSSLLLTNRTAASVITDTLSSLLPSAVRESLASGCPAPPLGALLVGPRGGGKTSLCRGVCDFFQTSARTVTHTQYMDCRELRGLQTKDIMDRMSSIFLRAEQSAPSFVCLDNLEALCAAQSDVSVSETQHRLVTMQLECLFSDLSALTSERYRHASALIDRIEEPSTEQTRRSVYDMAISHFLSGCVYVLASAESFQSLHPGLITQSSGHLTKIFPLKPLGSSARVSILKTALAHYGAPLIPVLGPGSTGVIPVLGAGSLGDAEAEGDVSLALEGFEPGDLWRLSKRLAVQAARKRGIHSSVPASSARTGGEVVSEREPGEVRRGLHTTHAEVLATCKEIVAQHSTSSSAPSTVRWSDIGGLEAAKAAITGVFQLPVVFRRLFKLSPIRMPRAILLYGPPGCGKTILAEAAANECGLAFISVRGPELLNKYIGASEKAVRDLFLRARSCGKPCIVFFDEFEALAPKRGKDNTGVTDRVVNQLLTLIDGADATMGGMLSDNEGEDGEEGQGGDGGSSNQVFILAATSRPDLIDVALLRPGRVEKHVYLGFPDAADRRDIMAVALRQLGVPLGGVGCGVSDALDAMCRDPRASLFTAADLAGLVKSAYVTATQEYIENSSSTDEVTTSSVGGSSRKMSRDDSALSTAASPSSHMRPRHLLDSLARSKASISEGDRAFYEGIYRRFRHSSGAADFDPADAAEGDVTHQRQTLV